MPDAPQSPSLLTVDSLRKLGHELRSPLSTIKGYATVLEEELGEFENVPLTLLEFAQIIRLSAERGLSEIPSLVDLLKIGTGNLTLSLSPVSVNEIVENVVNQYRAYAASAGLDLHIELAESWPVAWSEHDTLKRIVVELISNAIRFTPKGSITMRTATTTESVLIEVEDTGVGLSEDEAVKIFEPFVQLSPSQNAPEHHRGIGLALVNGFLSLMNGGIHVASKPGFGSRFTVELAPAPASDLL